MPFILSFGEFLTPSMNKLFNVNDSEWSFSFELTMNHLQVTHAYVFERFEPLSCFLLLISQIFLQPTANPCQNDVSVHDLINCISMEEAVSKLIHLSFSIF